ATCPSKRVITSEQTCWYARTMSRYSSGSSWLESRVESTRSQNITVSWRRSASGGEEPTGEASLCAGETSGVAGSEAGEAVIGALDVPPVQTSTRPSSSIASFL